MKRFICASRTHINRFAAASIALALFATGCGIGSDSSESTSSASNKEPMTIGLSYLPNVQFSPAYIVQQDHLVAQGVELHHHGQGEGLFSSLLSGKEQIVIAGADEAAAAANEDLVVIAPYYEQYPIRILVRADSTIHSIQDLKGKTVGLPGHYGENWFSLLSTLRAAGLKKSDIHIQEIGYTQVAALSSKKVDAVVGFINNDGVQLKRAGVDFRALDPKVGNLRSASIITTKEYAKNHGQELRDVVKALYTAYGELRDDPALGVTRTARFVPELNEEKQKEAALETMKQTAPLLPDGPKTCQGLTP